MKSSFTIGTKLMAAVGAMMTLTVVLSYYSLTAISASKAQFDNAIDGAVSKLTLAETIANANSAMVAAQKGVILSAFAKDKAEGRRSEREFRQSANVMRKSINRMRPLLIADENKRMLAEIDASETAWLPRFEEVVRKSGGGKAQEANRSLKDVTTSIATSIAANTEGLVAKQHDSLAQDKVAAADLTSRSRWAALILLGFGMLAGVGAGILVRNVNRVLRQAVTELYRGADEVSSAARQVAASSQSLANGASSQAASLEETSASSEEIRAMATQNTETTRSAAGLATESQQKFTDANVVLEQMVEAMSQINESSGKISRIIKVIDEIAFQTNILALNAAVEAARAGEAGLGFAVVADEVRNLAQRCAQAAKDTAVLIEDSGAKSAEGKAKVDQVAEFLRVVTGESNKVKMLVDDVNLGSQEQVRGIEQIAKAIVQMEGLTQATAASAEESAAAAEELTAQSNSVKEVAGRLVAMVGSAG
jgi:methyl-accepting chemotaxis protein/methyl-accepting chemotaxis protein-1 (serine sensor receptor)